MAVPIFDEDELAKLKKIVEVYLISKEMTLLGELMDPEQRTQLEIFEGYRHANDHMMRVLAHKLELVDTSKEKETKYTEVNLNSVLGHVTRAAYDAMDWIAVIIEDRIAKELHGYSEQTIQTVLPQYYPVIKPRITSILTNTFIKIRYNKDIGNDNTENLTEYATLIRELRQYFDNICGAESTLIEYEAKLQTTRRKDVMWKILGPVLGAIVGAIIALIVTFSRFG